jgi:serine/threonine-protein kinase RsbW
MSESCNSNGKLVLPSVLTELEKVDGLALECAKEAGLNEADSMMVAIAVIEAVTNAIVHGNHFADDKFVTIQFDCEPGKVKVIVHDEGKGFDLSCVWDPTSPDKQMECSGRGIYIMREVMDSVEFDMSDGTTVTMMKAV